MIHQNLQDLKQLNNFVN